MCSKKGMTAECTMKREEHKNCSLCGFCLFLGFMWGGGGLSWGGLSLVAFVGADSLPGAAPQRETKDAVSWRVSLFLSG